MIPVRIVKNIAVLPAEIAILFVVLRATDTALRRPVTTGTAAFPLRKTDNTKSEKPAALCPPRDRERPVLLFPKTVYQSFR